MTKRSTVELVVLAFTATVCLVLLLMAVALAIAGTVPPNDPLGTRYLDVLMTGTATILGALLGLLGGRASRRGVEHE